MTTRVDASSAISPSPRDCDRDRRLVFLCAVGLVLAIAVVYANSLGGPFVYDDAASIVYNPSIRHLWPLTRVFMPPADGTTVTGRPLLNLSFALDFAGGGLAVGRYHVTNILIHAATALLLFGVWRRSLVRSGLRSRLAGIVTPTACLLALLWALHPLQTEAVTYIVQRAEVLMSLCYVLTLYAFIRSVESHASGRWQIVAWFSCLAGMAVKENMVSAPVMVLLYDRAFVSGSLAAAWRARRRFYLALATTWLLLAWLVIGAGGNRGGSAGLDVGGGAGTYLLTQVPALARYAALTVWPHPLVFDYGAFTATVDAVFLLQAIAVSAGIAAALWALRSRPQLAFPALVALAVLAPTSLVPGTTQMIVEHRMYLPLAGLISLGLPLACLPFRRTLTVLVLLLALALGLAVRARNQTYRSAVALWSDTVAQRPDNAMAHAALGAALRAAGQNEAAAAQNRRALALNPGDAPALGNLGMHLAETGHAAEGLALIERAIALQPTSAIGHLFAGSALELQQQPAAALPHFAEAARLNPLFPLARYKYGDALARADRLDAAIVELEAVLAIDPLFADAYLTLATVQLRRGDVARAQALFARGAALRAQEPALFVGWGNVLLTQGHPHEAASVLRQAVDRAPGSSIVHYSLGLALTGEQQLEAAAREFETTVRLDPNNADAYQNLGNVQLNLARLDEAVASYERALQLRPDDAITHHNLGLALARLGRLRAALPHFDAAVRLAPDSASARANLDHARAQLESDPTTR